MEMSLPEIQLDSMVLFVMMGGTAVMQQLFAGDTNQIQYQNEGMGTLCFSSSFRQLGFTYGLPITNSYYGTVPSLFSMDDVQCTGSESSIQECEYILRDNCSEREGAGIICSNTARGT